MDQETFNGIVEERRNKILSVLAQKATEYARGDRLSNFKKGAALLGQTPELFCINLYMKHVVSIVDMIQDLTRDGELNVERYMATADEKLTDAINYPILLDGLLRDRFKTPDGQVVLEYTWTNKGKQKARSNIRRRNKKAHGRKP